MGAIIGPDPRGWRADRAERVELPNPATHGGFHASTDWCGPAGPGDGAGVGPVRERRQSSFPTSGLAAAQQHFLRGVAILHSFGWKQAIAEFKLAQKVAARLRDGLLGRDALLQPSAQRASRTSRNPRAVLARLGPDRGGARSPRRRPPREKGFLQAVEELWGEGDWRQRRVAYMNAMERLYEQFPERRRGEDVLRAVAPERRRARVDDSTSRYERQGRRAGDGCLQAQSEPSRARRTTSFTRSTIRSTRRWRSRPRSVYATIVPAVSHAVHMPTHIFIQHGMWNEVANQNMRAFNVAQGSVAARRCAGRHVALAATGGSTASCSLATTPARAAHPGCSSEMAETTKHRARSRRRGAGEGALHHRDRRVEGAAGRRDASNETLLANGFSAVKTGDLATAEKMEALLAAKAQAPRRRAARRAHADHGARARRRAAAAGADGGKASRIMHQRAGGADRARRRARRIRRSRC